MAKNILLGTASAAVLLAIMPHANAASTDAMITSLQQQIKVQQNHLQQQRQSLDALIAEQQETQAQVTATASAVKASTQASVAVLSRANRPGWRSADGRNEIDLGALLQVDAGVNRYKSGNPAAGLQKLQSGINARRAQLQVTGTFAEDFHFGLQYDMGGSNELFGGSAGGVAAGFKQALLTYDGIKPWGTTLSLEFGYESPPVLLMEVVPSNATPFIENPTADRFATGIGSGPGRGVIGARDFNDRFFGFFGFSGPKAGDVHDSTEGAMPIVAEGRAAFNIINAKDMKLQIGGGFQRYIQLSNNKYSLSDEAELRVDPTTFIGVTVPTTAANPVTGGGTYSAELAGQWGPIFASGSYIRFDAERRGFADTNFWGGFGQVMYMVTGEQHPYLASSGGWGNPSPAHPFSLKTGGIGAWEVGIRYSYMDMNSNLGTPANAVQGGHFNDLTLGVNWYVSDNIRFQLNWLHGFQGGLAGATGSATNQSGTKLTVANGRWDQIAIRSQFSF